MSRTVLVVDDHAGFRARARLLLEAEGYEVVGEAADGETALAEARRLRPEVVLLDVQLPDLDGFDVAARLTANGDGARGRADLEPRLVGLGRADPAQRRARLPAQGPALRRGGRGAARMRSLRHALIGIGLAGFAAGVVCLVIATSSDHLDEVQIGGVVFTPADRLVVHRHRPVRVVAAARQQHRPADDRGRLRLVRSGRCSRPTCPGCSRSAACSTPLPYALLLHMLVAFPSGRLETRTERILIGAAYFDTTVVQLGGILFLETGKPDTCWTARQTRC